MGVDTGMPGSGLPPPKPKPKPKPSYSYSTPITSTISKPTQVSAPSPAPSGSSGGSSGGGGGGSSKPSSSKPTINIPIYTLPTGGTITELLTGGAYGGGGGGGITTTSVPLQQQLGITLSPVGQPIYTAGPPSPSYVVTGPTSIPLVSTQPTSTVYMPPPPAPVAPSGGRKKQDTIQMTYQKPSILQTAINTAAFGGLGAALAGPANPLTSNVIGDLIGNYARKEQAEWQNWLATEGAKRGITPPVEKPTPGKTSKGETIGQQPGQRKLGETIPGAAKKTTPQQAAAQRMTDLANRYINQPELLPPNPVELFSGPGLEEFGAIPWQKLQDLGIGFDMTQAEAATWAREFYEENGYYPWEGPYDTAAQNLAYNYSQWMYGGAPETAVGYDEEPFFIGPVGTLYPPYVAPEPAYAGYPFGGGYYPFFYGGGYGGGSYTPPWYWYYPEMARGI